MKKLLFIFGLSFAICSNSIGQDSTAQADTNARSYQDVHVWADLVKPITQFISGIEHYEFGGGFVLLNHIQISGSYGFGKYSFSAPDAYLNGTYTTEGNYWRVGADYIGGKAAKTWLGLRFAQASYSDYATATLTSDLWDDYQVEARRQGVAQWYELVVGTESPLLPKFPALNTLTLGGIFRVRALNNLQQPDQIPIFYLPGYGRTANPITIHLNVTLRYRFTF